VQHRFKLPQRTEVGLVACF